jgi:two-component system cell cycle response regulator
LARYGGEEFIIVVPETDFEGACLMSNRICRSIAQKTIYALEDRIQITASFGVTSFDPDTPAEMISPEAMINQADKYLFKAKKQGRNQVKGQML